MSVREEHVRLGKWLREQDEKKQKLAKRIRFRADDDASAIEVNFFEKSPQFVYTKTGVGSWYTGIHEKDSTFKISYGDDIKAYVNSDDSRVTNLNFTGQHRTFIKDVPYTKAHELRGLIVSTPNNSYVKMSGSVEVGSNAITINESLPLVSLSNVAYDKRCFGVISDAEDADVRTEAFGNFISVFKREKGDARVYINSVGEGAMWVLVKPDEVLEAGDYITTSNVAGYGQLQKNDDILHNYTVAKLTMDVHYDPPEIPKRRLVKEMSNVTYWYQLTDVDETEWRSLNPNQKRTKTEVYHTLDTRIEVAPSLDPQSNIYVAPNHDLELYIKTQESVIDKEAYDALPQDEQGFYKLDGNVYVYKQVTEISQEEWNSLSSDEQNTYSHTYFVVNSIEVDPEFPNAVERVREIPQKLIKETTTEPEERLTDYLSEVRQECVNVLDEHGQLQWEDVPSGETEPAYRIRYLDADGKITTSENEVYRAAFVGVTYHCG